MEAAVSTALVPHPGTGEVVDLSSATDAEVVDYIEAVENAADQLKAFKSLASTELVERLDRSGEWTRRVDVRGTTYEIKSTSPTAGTESYDDEQVIAAVAQLVADGVIDESAAGKTVRHIVAVEFTTGDAKAADEIEQEAKRDVRYPTVERSRKVAKTGINALLKIPAAKDSIEACKTVSAPKSAAERRVSVKVKDA